LSTASSDVSKPEAESLDTRTAPPKQQVPYLWPSPFQTSEQLCVENLLFWDRFFFKKADPSWKISNKFDWIGKGHSPGRCNQSCMVCFKAASSVRPALYVCAGSFFHFLKEPHFNGSKSLKGGALTS
jgi:hypothetical protein